MTPTPDAVAALATAFDKVGVRTLATNLPDVILTALPAGWALVDMEALVERVADQMMDNVPQIGRWLMTGWRDTMRDEAATLARRLLGVGE